MGSKPGAIQNEEFVIMALREGREFILLCNSKDDAQSKRVSLYNARKRLEPKDQKRIKIRILHDNEEYRISVSRVEQEALEVINGELIPYVPEEDRKPMSEENKTYLREMLSNSVNEDVVISSLVLRGESELVIKEEIKKVSI
jgi:hypothetical protein